MIDIKEIRENPDKFKKAATDKHFDVDIDRLLTVDADLQALKKELQDIVTEKNKLGKLIPTLKDENEKKLRISHLSVLKNNEAKIDADIKLLQPQFDKMMLVVAQPADDDVPIGKDETENVEIRREGEVRQFDFEPKDHVQLGEALDIIDIERGVKLAGTRNYILKGDGALLHWAVLRFAMDYMVGKGYAPMSVPVLAKDKVMEGTGFFPGSEDQTYRLEADQLNLAGTAEVPLTAYRMGEILKADELPLKFVAMSSCFRREAGAAGKDTYGLYRIHQFDKVEQVVICKNSVEESNKFHEEILANSEAVMKALELPYRVVNVCTGDLGRGQVKKYDIEAWMPSRKNYCETHSASKFYEFQARRMDLRYKDAETKKNLFCHTLNNTVIASPRILIPILELYQNADGSVTIPKVLQPYMGGKEKIGAGR
jgi:seryl-tRNA synthetase